MKNLTLILFVLFPILLLSQTQTENYIKTTVYQASYKGMPYSNYSQSLGITDLIYTSSGGASGSIAINNNVLTASISGSWSQQSMKLGVIKTLTVTPVLPKIELGPILSSGNQTGYFAKIENNNLVFYSPYFLTGVSTNISANISGSAPGINYSVSIGNPYTCPYGGGGGGSGAISINNGIAALSISGGWSGTCNFKTGQIVYLSTATIPNTELGVIKDQNGLDTNYRAKIENNWLVFYAVQPVPAFPSSGSLSFTLNLGISQKDKLENISYFDGLGRPKQSIAIGQGGDASDVVKFIEYDGFGRQEKEYLAYAVPNAGNGDIKVDPLTAVLGFYNQSKYENTANPFSQKLIEPSPINRVLKQTAPGNAWALNATGDDHSIKTDRQTNILNEVKLFTVTTTLDVTGVQIPTITNISDYSVGQLYKTITKDENWVATVPASELDNKTTEEFKDMEGRVVLIRTYSDYTDTRGVILAAQVSHDTYYIYDPYGNLTYVLPPKSEGLIDSATLNNLCYQYKYDYRNRLVEKKLPGKPWEFIVYDKLDRPILTQDANLKAANKWMFTKYDAFSRPVYTGEYLNAVQITRADVQTLASASAILFETKQGLNTINGTTVYYSNNAFPNINNTNINLFTINYYDDYGFDLNGGVSETGYGITPITNAKGLATGSKVRILGTVNWTTNVNYYDVKGRPIYIYSKNDYLATTSKVKSQLDFPGKTLETTSSHTRASVTTNIVDTFVYDNSGRLLTQKQKINSQLEEIIVSNTYDNLGQLTSKGIGGKTTQSRLQTIDFKYNIRGWLKNINDVNAIGTDLFAFQINYNDIADVSKKLYNGNISQTFWKTANADTSLKNYIYTYDSLNRLTTATDNLGKFNENLSYDKNGNIMNLTRLGEIVGGVPLITNPADFGAMDELTYSYDSGNRLMKVADAAVVDGFGFKDDALNIAADTADDYTYDDNGNMKTDTNKGITAIFYNYLNLPTQVTIGVQNINYVYDATGVKQQKTANGITTDYAGGFIYEANQLKFFSQPEGYVAYNSGIFSYIYQYKDHLGNVRLSYGDKDNSGSVTASEIVEENNYYPFGLKHKGYNNGFVIGNGNATAQKYKYQGKELQDELGLNFYDMEARNYDPALGRFMNIDPMAESYYQHTPYNYVGSNPVIRTDPTGMDWYTDKKGNQTYNENLTKDNASSILKKGQAYSGTTATENVSNDVGDYTLTYNADGSISSSEVTNSHIATDGTRVFGAGGDTEAGSGGMGNDRGSGSVQADMGDVGMLFDFGQMLGNLINSIFGNEKSSTNTNLPTSQPSTTAKKKDQTKMSTQDVYYAPNVKTDKIEPYARVTTDTTVNTSDINKVIQNQTRKNQQRYNEAKKFRK